ncbi:hypothetical protein HETIRDRAFT_450287 [Heterobasidion irregulare TC 32-1]|uniref:Uncharacterized protein n=1 Tax=Heterobasidion irregulare (strain TC 32-1) TaxID=747525 RepID=W4KBF1_HETIT|nr:uncharacterized protein HETIRDRAFT_450287 [Heterobasidion irregulare TC 32-1]ETW82381.1 hypothetical protein HETIRDRAFT_450287 [Heterobasidion irregulare TC 32-1]
MVSGRHGLVSHPSVIASHHLTQPPRVSHDGLEPAAPAKDLAKLSPYASELYRVRLLGSTGPVIHGPSTFLEFTSSHRYTSLLNIALSRDRGATEPRALVAFIAAIVRAFVAALEVTLVTRALAHGPPLRFTRKYSLGSQRGDIADDSGQDIADDLGEDIADNPGQDVVDDLGQDVADNLGQDITDNSGQDGSWRGDIVDDSGQDVTDNLGQDVTDNSGQDVADDSGLGYRRGDVADDSGQDIADDLGEDITDNPGQDVADDLG